MASDDARYGESGADGSAFSDDGDYGGPLSTNERTLSRLEKLGWNDSPIWADDGEERPTDHERGCDDSGDCDAEEGYVEPYVNPFDVMFDEILKVEERLYKYARAFDDCGAIVRPGDGPRYVLVSRDGPDLLDQCCPITGMMVSPGETDSGRFFKCLVLVDPEVKLMALGRTNGDHPNLGEFGWTPMEMPVTSGVVIAPGAVYTKNLDVSPENPHTYWCTAGEHETVKGLVDSLVSKYRGSHGDVRNYDMPSVWLGEYLETLRRLRDSTHKSVVREELSMNASQYHQPSDYSFQEPFYTPIRVDFDLLLETGTVAFRRFMEREGGIEALEDSYSADRNLYVALVAYSCDTTVCAWFNGGTTSPRRCLEPRHPVRTLVYEAGTVSVLKDWSLEVGSVAAATAALAATAGALICGGDGEMDDGFFGMCKQGYDYAADTPADAIYNGLCALGTMALFVWSVQDRSSAGNGHALLHPGGQRLVRRSYSADSDL
jgi:hypothetical protein